MNANEGNGKMQRIFTLIMVLICLFTFVKIVEACEGARPLAMGGAFTGLADDANANYWNPAALGLLKRLEATYTGTVYDRDVMNYDDWVSMVISSETLSDNNSIDWGTLGFYFMNNIDENIYYDRTDRWYGISYGRELKEVVEGLCIGAGIRFTTVDSEVKKAFTLRSSGTTYAVTPAADDSCVNIDLAAYYLWRDLSAGILVQSVNEPEITIFGKTANYIINIRPGIAYRFKDRFIVSAEIYDAADQGGAADIRIGAEAQVTDNIALRAGAYDIADDVGCALTGGIGFASKELIKGKDIELDLSYGVMYWYESEGETEDKFTHLLSLTTTF